MKNYYRKNQKRSMYLILILIFLLITSIGYAVFTEQLDISGTVSGNATFKVYFIDAWAEDSTKGTATINNDEDTVTFTVSLGYPGDRVLIGTKIKNESSVAVKLNDFTPTSIANNSDIKFDYVTLDTNTEILQPGEICDYEFVVYWDKNSKNQTPSNVSFDIQLDYDQFSETLNSEKIHSHDSVWDLTINYIDESGKKLANSYNICQINGFKYSVKSPTISGYVPNNNIIEGELLSDTEINVVYYKSSGRLAYANIDANTCMVSGIGTCTDTNIVIPEEYNGRKVVQIKEAAFRNNQKIQSIIIPSTVKKMNQYSFSGCSNLESVTILSENLGNIEDENFIGCVSLERFIVNSDNTSYKVIDGILFSKDETQLIRYPQGKKDTEYTIPSSVTTIATRGLDQNQYLEKIIIPETVETVGDYAIALLPQLKSLTINAKTVTGQSAFCDNYYLSEIIIGNNLKNIKEGKDVFRKVGMNLSNSITIQYDGTKAEWNSIPKQSNWRASSKIVAVECIDGTITF